MNEDMILIEQIDDLGMEGTPVIAIAMNDDGSINYESMLNPKQTALILNGLAGNIMESYFG